MDARNEACVYIGGPFRQKTLLGDNRITNKRYVSKLFYCLLRSLLVKLASASPVLAFPVLPRFSAVKTRRYTVINRGTVPTKIDCVPKVTVLPRCTCSSGFVPGSTVRTDIPRLTRCHPDSPRCRPGDCRSGHGYAPELKTTVAGMNRDANGVNRNATGAHRGSPWPNL